MGKMVILNETGHSELAWSTGDEESVAEAQAAFLHLVKENYVPMERKPRAYDDEFVKIERFDPTLGEIFWIRPLKGGAA